MPTTQKDTLQDTNGKKPRRSGRKRILSFDELPDQALIEKTKKRIEELKAEIQDKKLISLQKWCEGCGIDPAAMIRLLFESDLPVIRIGAFQGVYQEHLHQVLLKETERQLEQQIQNRLCAKMVAERQHKEKADKKKEKG